MFGSPLSMIIVPEPLVDPVVPEPLDESVVPEPLDESVVPEPLVEPDEDVLSVELVETRLTASADVTQLLIPFETVMILAAPLKLYVPNRFH